MTEGNPDDGDRVDLARYGSVDEALSVAANLADQLSDISARAVTDCPAELFGTHHIFLMSAMARAQGLHDGITREIQANDPHTVFPLLRTYLDLGALLTYVTERPTYIHKLVVNPRDSVAGRGRASFQTILSVVRRRYPGVRKAWAELSEFGHFGSFGVWASWSFDDTDPEPGTLGLLRHRPGPGWRDKDRDPKLAAGWLVEANEMALREGTRFLEAHVLPINRKSTKT